ncbi:unnamed protein product [Urochloa humidicola]
MPEVEVERRTTKGKAAVATCKPALQACKTKLTRRVMILYEIMNCAQPFQGLYQDLGQEIPKQARLYCPTNCFVGTLSGHKKGNIRASSTLHCLPEQLTGVD